jgi:hypothetical protein
MLLLSISAGPAIRFLPARWGGLLRTTFRGIRMHTLCGGIRMRATSRIWALLFTGLRMDHGGQ